MRILQIITLADSGGAQSVVLNLANSLINNNIVAVVASSEGPMWTLLDPAVTQYKVKSFVREISPRKDIMTLLSLRRIYRDFRPDIIHLHSSKAGLLGRIALPGQKIIYTVHGFDSIRLAFRKFLSLERIFQNMSSAIIAVSDYDRKNLIKERITRNVYTIYNGLEIYNRHEIEWPIKRSERTILSIARIGPQKNFRLFIQIAELLPKYNFVWIGNQSSPDCVIPSNVFLLGELPEAYRYYKHADLCLLTSNYEGLPMCIIEAMALSKPIVASDVGGISEIVLNGQNGFVVQNDPVLFVQKISLILKSDEMIQRFGKMSRAIYEDRLTVQKMKNEYMEIYSQV